MRPLAAFLLSLLLAACASQPPSAVNAKAGNAKVGNHDGGQASTDRIYSYVDAQGHLVQGELPAKKTKTSKQQEQRQPGQKAVPKIYSYKDAQGHLVTGELPPQATAANEKATAANEKPSYQSPQQAEAALDARAHDRFVTYYDASGRLVREHVDPVTAKAYQQELVTQQNYQQIAAVAAQQSRDRQYVETTTAIPADCCKQLLPHADKLNAGKQKSLTFSNGEYGWIKLSANHPAHIYALGEKDRRIAITSFKVRGSYLHPYMLFLDAKGVPVLAVNNLFQRRYPETWYRYGYVEGSVVAPATAVYVVVYLPYESGSRETGMVPFPAPSLVSEADATPANHGQLVISAHPI